MKQRPRAVLAMASRYVAGLFPAPVLDRLRASADLDPEVVIEDFGEAELADVDVLITGWGCPPITAEVLERAPRLRAAFHAAAWSEGARHRRVLGAWVAHHVRCGDECVAGG